MSTHIEICCWPGCTVTLPEGMDLCMEHAFEPFGLRWWFEAPDDEVMPVLSGLVAAKCEELAR